LVGEDAEARRRHLEAMCHLFFGTASQQPLLIFLDDLQWAPFMDVLQALAQHAPSHPLLLIGAYRDSELRERPILSRSVLDMYRNRLSLSLPLHRLDRNEVSQMVTEILRPTSSGHLVDLIFNQTEGNPFYVEELVGYLVESGSLTLEGEVWNVRETSALQMPDTVKLVVEERLERLHEETRRTLAMASVIGQEFTLPVLQEITGVDEEALVDAVDNAVEARLLVPRSGVGREVFAFADNQVLEFLYQDTGTARRRRYHLRVGEAIEKVHSRRLEEYYGALGHHFLEGHDLEKAAVYSIKAGDSAQWDSPQAQAHYRVAVEVLEELGEESERSAHAQRRLGDNIARESAIGVYSKSKKREGIQYISRALETFLKLGNPRRAARLHRLIAGIHYTGEPSEQAWQEFGRHAQAAVDLLAGEGNSPEKSLAYDSLASWHARNFALDLAEESAREALRIAEAVTDVDGQTCACTDLGLVLVRKGSLRSGMSYAERGLADAHRATTPILGELAAAFPIVMYPWLGETKFYHEWFDRYEELRIEAKSQRHQLQVLGILAAVSVQGGNPERGKELLGIIDQLAPDATFAWQGVGLALLGNREAALRDFVALDWTNTNGFRPAAIDCARVYGQLLPDEGDYHKAEELLRIQWEYCRESGAVISELDLLPTLCESYSRLGEIAEARSCLERAREILAMPEDWKGLAAGVYVAEALLAATEERWEEAETTFQRAADINQQHGLVYDRARVLYQWAVMVLESPGAGDRKYGLDLLDQS